MINNVLVVAVSMVLLASPAMAQTKPGPALAKNQPIEISSDMLDVHQDEHKAIFSGNVIAKQGTTNLRSKIMTVYYRQGETKTPGDANPAAQGISRIDAEGSVVFATPTETAQGDLGVYNADTDTIELTGSSVTLMRDKNILKGQKLTYNMATGRSLLTAGGAPVSGSTGGQKPARVQGLFVPKSEKN